MFVRRQGESYVPKTEEMSNTMDKKRKAWLVSRLVAGDGLVWRWPCMAMSSRTVNCLTFWVWIGSVGASLLFAFGMALGWFGWLGWGWFVGLLLFRPDLTGGSFGSSSGNKGAAVQWWVK